MPREGGGGGERKEGKVEGDPRLQGRSNQKDWMEEDSRKVRKALETSMELEAGVGEGGIGVVLGAERGRRRRTGHLSSAGNALSKGPGLVLWCPVAPCHDLWISGRTPTSSGAGRAQMLPSMGRRGVTAGIEAGVSTGARDFRTEDGGGGQRVASGWTAGAMV